MSRDEDADPDGYSEQELPRPTARVRFMQGNHRTDRDDDVASDAITLDLMNAYRDRERRLTTQVRQLQCENDDFRTQVDKLSARLEEEAAVQSRKKDTTAKDLQKQLGEMRLELEAKSTKLEESQRHKDYLISQLAEKTTELQRVSVATPPSNALVFFASQLTEKSAEVAKVRQENERLQQTSDRVQQENGRLLEMTERLRDEIANASKLIAEFEHQKTAWQADRNTDRQADIDRLKAAAEQNSALKQSIAERDRKIVEMEHELCQERKRVLAKTEAHDKELKSLQAELESFKRTMESERQNAQKQLDAQNQLTAQNRALLERISAQEKEISSLKGRQHDPPNDQRENFAAGVMTGESALVSRMRETNFSFRRVGERPGLINLGSTCWLNSQTQILFCVPAYRDLLINHLPVDEWKQMAENSPFVRFVLLRRQLFARMLVAERTALNPMEMVRFSCQLSECQDASEMLLHEFDWLEKAVRLGCSEEVSQMYYWQRYLQIEKDKINGDIARNDGFIPALIDKKKWLDDLAKQKPPPKFVASMSDYLPRYVFEESSGPEFRCRELQRLFRGLVQHSTVELTDSGKERKDISWSPVFPLHIQSGNLMAALERAWHDGPKRRTYVVDAPALMMYTLSRFDFNPDTGRTTKRNDPFHFPAKFRLTRFEHQHHEQIEKTLEKRNRDRHLLAIVEQERNKLSTMLTTNANGVSSSDAAAALVTFLEANKRTLTRGVRGESEANRRVCQLKDNMPWLRNEIQHRVKELDDQIEEKQRLVNGAFDELEREFASSSPYYHLYAIVIHMGEVTTGHYWTLVRNRIHTNLVDIDEDVNQPKPDREDDWWWKFDDSKSSRISWEQAMHEALGNSSDPYAPSAYILCYARESELHWLFDEEKIPLEERLTGGNDLLQDGNDARLFKDSSHYKWLINALPDDLKQQFQGDGKAASQNSRL